MKCIDFGSVCDGQYPPPQWDNPESECYGCKTHSIFDCEKCAKDHFTRTELHVYEPPDEPNCHKCPAINRCISGAIDNLAIRCLHYGWLKTQVDKTIDKLGSAKAVYPIYSEEIKS